ncbi:acetyltransferase [Saccharobesus litoralis]|uniref:Acetyltransferase n=1 Tax=Saccharobesus litoralis TaxID=2172099 RepID=A0A2S0VR91_9ALTE|nr:acetyltransferase [Saccharobesus litoralis]AWB66737.1 acetyltransferase [Saccharobesus litoralis]
MPHFDVFNGDADGICALLQLRLAQPRDAELITGVKRDIKLLSQVKGQADSLVTVLDISMDKNHDALLAVLADGAQVFYCDHHFAGDMPQHANLETLINTAPDTCTSLLINQYLNGAYANWAIVAAYGDNILTGAEALADQQGLSQTQRETLKALGIAINYNGYGASLADLHITPAELFKRLLAYPDPLEFAESKNSLYQTLLANYQADLDKVKTAQLVHESPTGRIYQLPNQAWARRISGVWGNDLANERQNLAHAVLTDLDQGGYLVSVRAPKNNPLGADELCRQFATGGGRKAAAGINNLPNDELQRFITTFEQTFS